MNKTIQTLVLVVVSFFSAWAYPTGTNFLSDYSGISGTTCNMATCHTGTVLNAGPGSVSISTDIPGSGYVGGQTYRVKVTVTSGGQNGARYGFACSAAKEGSSTAIGIFSTIDNTTLAKNGGRYIVHNDAPFGNGNTVHEFEFDWTAPEAGTGNIKFFAAANSADGNGTNTGDHIYTSTATIQEIPNVGIAEAVVEAFDLFPNPVDEQFYVQVPDYMQEYELLLTDLSGKVLLVKQVKEGQIAVNADMLYPGMYMVHIRKKDGVYSKMLVKR